MTTLLVCGSRALGAHTRWVEAQVLRALADVWSLGPVTVVTGDARGPDEDAHRMAGKLLAIRYRFTLAGVIEGEVLDRRHWARWLPSTPPDDWYEPTRRPLVRNAAMVQWVASQPGERRCLALVAPWSVTHGTEHTAALAERAGIPTTRVTYTAEETRR